MGDESGIEAEMGNQNGAAKKRKKDEVVNGKGDTSDEDSDYKYVSIVDVNPASEEDSVKQLIEEDSVRKLIEEDSMSQMIEVNPLERRNDEVKTCSVMIGQSPRENGLSRVSRVSVNGEFDCDIPNGSNVHSADETSCIDQLGSPNGSSSFIEKVSDSYSSPCGRILNGSPTKESVNLGEIESKSGINGSCVLVDELSQVNGSSSIIDEGSVVSSPSQLPCSNGPHPAGLILNGSSTDEKVVEDAKPKSDTSSATITNGHVNGLSSPVEITPNGLSTFGNDSEGIQGEDSLEERLSRAVRETLDGHPLTDGLQEVVERVVREKLKRQRSGSSDCWNHDDTDDHCIVDFLDKINDHAEARLLAKRQARAEAREIRMRELEKIQRESEDGDKVYDAYPSPVEAVNRCVRAGSVTTPRSLLSSNNSYHSSRRSSEDSLEEINSIRDARHELRELEEKFRKAMIANAQLDNEKAAIAYQVDLFKDRYEELEEQNLQLMREHKETCRQLEQTKRHRSKLQEDLDTSRSQLGELLQLIQEKGLVVVEGDCSSDEESEGSPPRTSKPPRKALVSAEVADVLQQGSGSLDVRLKKFVEERNELADELRRVKLELEEERTLSRGRHANGPTGDSEDIQREANKLLGDYKFKLQKAEQDVSTLQANVARLESQVVRYKSAAETSEKLEDELKLEKRKLQRELREAQARVEELETSHSHLQKRLDKLKNAKSALLKDL